MKRILIWFITIVVVIGAGYLVYEKKFAHPAPQPSKPPVNNTTSSTSPPANDTSSSNSANGEGNSSVSGSPTNPLNTSQNVAFNVTTAGPKQNGVHTKSWMQVTQTKMWFPKSNGHQYTALKVGLKLHNGTSSSVTINMDANKPAIFLQLPAGDMGNMFSGSGAQPSQLVIIPPSTSNAQQVSVKMPKKLTIGAGKTVNFNMAWVFPAKLKSADFKNKNVTIVWNDGTGSTEIPIYAG